MVEELEAAAAAAGEAKKAYDTHMKRVRELLPRARVECGLTVVQLEAAIGRVYDRGTISRLTAKAAGTSKPKKPASA